MGSSKDEQLLDSALNMDHEQAKRIVQAFFSGEQEELTQTQELAFAHIHNCMEIECIKF